jgi:hypothetical protein
MSQGEFVAYFIISGGEKLLQLNGIVIGTAQR